MTDDPRWSRARSFCRYCGALTAYLDSCCGAHRDLLRAERHLIPPDPLATLPTLAAQLREDATPTKGMED